MTSLPRLSAALVRDAAFRRGSTAKLPDPALLDLPEKAVQFGTGAFLRGFVDAFLDESNRQGRFGGRVVAVASTSSGRDEALNEQDGLYTLLIEGMEQGAAHQERRIVASVSRALSAPDEWDAVCECARNPDLELVFSNTTEVGIVLDESDHGDATPPRSFPGKLARFLYERARTFDYDVTKGLTVVPCELIEENGERLCAIVLALAARWRLGGAFIDWIETAVPFCNTLVDRIVPGTPPPDRLVELNRTLGYRDALITSCERYRLFAIEGNEEIRVRLPFAADTDGLVIAEDIAPYRERKVRLLNGAHTAMVSVALLAGCRTVLQAMQHQMVRRFVERLMLEEIAPSLDVPDAFAFARDVLDRFGNPHIQHALLDITLQATTKMRVRVLPSIVRHAKRTGQPPRMLSLGFAAHLFLLRHGPPPAVYEKAPTLPPDEQGERLKTLWRVHGDDDQSLARAACGDVALWGTDLSRVPGFVSLVVDYLREIRRMGINGVLDALLTARRQGQGTHARLSDMIS
ncbi:MAG TPA: tagaturonate reductase [Gemmatimonadaceae bacterium]|nr:tagaturonate reductase [Gemmatimonadaceae bacterium]